MTAVAPAMRFFNKSGPVVAEYHYCIPPLERLNLAEVRRFIRDKRYFALRTPRQTGKTSTLLALRDQLNAEGAYRCASVNLEAVCKLYFFHLMRLFSGDTIIRGNKMLATIVNTYMYLYRTEGTEAQRSDSGSPVYTKPSTSGNTKIVDVVVATSTNAALFSLWENVTKTLNLKPISP